MPNPLAKLVNPRYPSTALGFEKGIATMVQLERGRGGSFSLRRAATVALPESLVRPSFEEPNISDPAELTVALRAGCRQPYLNSHIGVAAGVAR